MLGKQVCRIDLAGDLAKIHPTIPDSLLDPEEMGV
jgi:hypothetical protein